MKYTRSIVMADIQDRLERSGFGDVAHNEDCISSDGHPDYMSAMIAICFDDARHFGFRG